MLGEDPLLEGDHATGVAPWTDLGAVEFCLGPQRIGPPDQDPLGVCVADDAPPAPACRDDAGCESREQCLCGRCTAVACREDRDCGAGRVCDVNEEHPRCARPCSQDAQCAPGELCSTGACRAGCATAADCQHGEVCSPSLGRCIAPHCPSAPCLPGETCRLQTTPRALAGPTAVSRGDDLVLYVDSAGEVLRAVGTSGTAFRVDPAGPVARGAAPSALLAQGRVLLFVERDGAIWRAASDDGRVFGDAEEVLRADRAWEGGALSAPAAVATEDGLALAYATRAARGLGLARGASEGALAKEPEPVLAPADVADALLWRGVTRLGDPALALAAGPGQATPVLRLFFAAHGTESAASVEFGRIRPPVANFSIGYAAADARGGPFATYAFNPILDRSQAFLAHLEETGPAPVFHGGRWLLYYEAGAAGRPRSGNVGVAVNPPLVAPRAAR